MRLVDMTLPAALVNTSFRSLTLSRLLKLNQKFADDPYIQNWEVVLQPYVQSALQWDTLLLHFPLFSQCSSQYKDFIYELVGNSDSLSETRTLFPFCTSTDYPAVWKPKHQFTRTLQSLCKVSSLSDHLVGQMLIYVKISNFLIHHKSHTISFSAFSVG